MGIAFGRREGSLSICRSAGMAWLFMWVLFACAPKKEIRYIPYDPSQKIPYRAVGLASWYGPEFHGRRTANGEIYDMYAMTAAHRTLPFNVRVRVTNLENGKRAEFRINDRGPFVSGRIIDLSKSGAEALGFLSKGTARVEIETIGFAGGKAPQRDGTFSIQVGAFLDKENAERFRARLEKRHSPVRILPFETQAGKFYRVRLGNFRTEEEAQRYLENLPSEEFQGFIVRED